MAGKDYTVKLDLDVGQAITNIDEVLRKVKTLSTSLTDMDGTEVAFNVAIRNTGFQNMVAMVNRVMLTIEERAAKAGANIGDDLVDGIDKSGKKLRKRDSGFSQAVKQIAADVKAQMEGSLKGLDSSISNSEETIKKSLTKAFDNVGEKLQETIADSVTKGMVKGMRNLTHGTVEHFQDLSLNFRTNFEQFDSGLDKIRQLADTIDQFIEELSGGFSHLAKIKDMLGGGNAQALRDMAKGLASQMVRQEWEKDHMSLKDRRHADVEDRRIALEEKRFGLDEENVMFNQELARLREENAERRKGIELTNEQNRADKLNAKQLETLSKQQKVYDTEAERSQKKLQEEDEKRAMLKTRRAEQIAQIEQYAHENATRNRIQDTDLEKALYNYQKASLRVKQQISSTERNLKVDESAIAQAAKDKKDAEIEVSKQILRQVSGYKQIQENSEKTVKSLQRAATSLQRWSSAVSSIGGILSTFRQLSTTMASSIMKAGSTFLGYARQAASTIGRAATEQYRQLELAQIGFTNFYGAEKADDLIKQIKEKAMVSPGVDAGDLASYVRQLAPVSNGDSQQALDAAMGMLKTIQYGGGEASEEMEYVIKNIRDVISKGTATAIDLRQFNRAMPIMEDVLESIGKSEFIKNGQLKINKSNAKDLLQAFADINNDPNSPVVDIFEQMSNTLSGITDVIKQTFITKFNDTLIDLGFYDRVKEILKDLSKSGAIEKFYTFLANTANRILDFVKSLDWDSISKNSVEGAKSIWQAIKDVAEQIMRTLGATDLGGLIKKLADIIAAFIRGFGDGVNNVLEVINWAEQNIGPDVLSKAASFMGMLASPLGRLLQAAFGIVQNVLNFGSRGLYNLASAKQIKAENTLEGLNKWVSNPETLTGYKNSIDATISNGVVMNSLRTQDLHPEKLMSGGSFKKGSMWIYDKFNDTFSSQTGLNGDWNTAGGLSNLRREKGLFRDRDIMRIVGEGSMLKGYGRVGLANAKTLIDKAAKNFMTLAQKGIKSFAIASVGNVVSDIASDFAREATGSEYVGDVVEGLGKTASMAVALGSQFGLLGTAAGSLLSIFNLLNDASEGLRKAYESELKQKLETMYGQTVNDVWLPTLDQLKAQGLFEEYDDTSQTAKDAAINWLYEQVRNGVSDVNQLFSGAKNEYLTTRAGIRAAYQFNEDAPQIQEKLETTTRVDPNTAGNEQKLKSIYEKGVQMQWWNEAQMDITNAKEYLNYLSKQGIQINSQEFLDQMYTEVSALADNFAKEASIEVPVILKDSNGNTYSNANEWAAAEGWQNIDGLWYRNAKVYIEYEEFNGMSKTGQTHKAKHADGYSFGDALSESFDRIIGSGNPLLPWARDGWFNFKPWWNANGGKIKPIYRANGGDSRGVDTVPAMLQPGEFVVRKAAVGKIGMGVLNALNYGDLGKAARLLGARFSGNWNNARSYTNNRSTINKYQSNYIAVQNRTRGGALSSYNALANRLATGF